MDRRVFLKTVPTFAVLTAAQSALAQEAESIVREIRKAEKKRRIWPRTPKVHFGLSDVVLAWFEGCEFSELVAISGEDEGGLVRHFRRAIQFLRQIRKARGTSDDLAGRLWRASEIMKRDVVDAERQLRIE